MIRVTNRKSPATRRAFTLVEMVIAIGIIVILAVLTVTAAGMLVQKSEIRQTENVLTILDMAVQEWESSADRKLSWGERNIPYSGVRYDLENGTPHVYTITETLRHISKSSQAGAILARIAPEFVYKYDTTLPMPEWISPGAPDDPDPNAGGVQGIYTSNDLNGDALDGELAVIDAWGMPIRAVHAGRVADFPAFGDDLTLADADGTIFVDDSTPGIGSQWYATEMLYGAAQGRRLRFVSAGPDRRFGNISEPEGTPPHDAAHDNIYSYAVEDTHP